MLSWSFFSVLLQLSHWMDLRGFHHLNGERGLALQLWATTETWIQEEGGWNASEAIPPVDNMLLYLLVGK